MARWNVCSSFLRLCFPKFILFGLISLASPLTLPPLQIHKFVPVSGLKYYFRVNNSFVSNKLNLLVFPYTQKVTLTKHTYTHKEIHTDREREETDRTSLAYFVP